MTITEIPIYAYAESAGVGKSFSGIMARQAGERIIFGESGFEEEFPAQGDALFSEWIIKRKIGHREGGSHLEAVGGVFLREIERLSSLSRNGDGH